MTQRAAEPAKLSARRNPGSMLLQLRFHNSRSALFDVTGCVARVDYQVRMGCDEVEVVLAVVSRDNYAILRAYELSSKLLALQRR